jgi:hypothetical protein
VLALPATSRGSLCLTGPSPQGLDEPLGCGQGSVDGHLILWGLSTDGSVSL